MYVKCRFIFQVLEKFSIPFKNFPNTSTQVCFFFELWKCSSAYTMWWPPWILTAFHREKQLTYRTSAMANTAREMLCIHCVPFTFLFWLQKHGFSIFIIFILESTTQKFCNVLTDTHSQLTIMYNSGCSLLLCCTTYISF
jgi:hypothetical protein